MDVEGRKMILPIAYGVAILLSTYLIFQAFALSLTRQLPVGAVYFLLLASVIGGLILASTSIWFLVAAVIASIITIFLEKLVNV